MIRKKVKWSEGSVFVVKLRNHRYAVGQVLDLRFVNCVRCALFDEVFEKLDQITLDNICKINDLISLVEVTRELLDSGSWPIVGNREVEVPNSRFPNEQYKDANWIGAKTFDASLLEDFFNAYYGLVPWDDWHDPNYLDRFLVDISRKPTNLIYSRR